MASGCSNGQTIKSSFIRYLLCSFAFIHIICINYNYIKYNIINIYVLIYHHTFV